jgi:hypothetical protein
MFLFSSHSTVPSSIMTRTWTVGSSYK